MRFDSYYDPHGDWDYENEVVEGYDGPDDEDFGDDAREIEVPDNTASEPGPCVICGNEARHICMECGKHVCGDPNEYFGDTKCAAWDLDTWHPSHPEENVFRCYPCLNKVYAPETESTVSI